MGLITTVDKNKLYLRVKHELGYPLRPFEIEDVKLNFDKDALHQIAEIAIKQKIGARGLRAIMEKFMIDIMYDIPDQDEIESCTISKDVVLGEGKPKFGLKEDKKDKSA